MCSHDVHDFADEEVWVSCCICFFRDTTTRRSGEDRGTGIIYDRTKGPLSPWTHHELLKHQFLEQTVQGTRV
jgi:hypothetical protein